MKKNIVLGTSVPSQVAHDVESLVELGKYRSKSDFLYQAVVEKGALREFPGFGGPRARLHYLFEHGPEDERAAVAAEACRCTLTTFHLETTS
jgi:hypothetical protein